MLNLEKNEEIMENTNNDTNKILPKTKIFLFIKK